MPSGIARHEIRPRLPSSSWLPVERGSALATRAGETMQSRDVDRFSDGVERIDAAPAGNVGNMQGVASAAGDLREQARMLSVAIPAFIVER